MTIFFRDDVATSRTVAMSLDILRNEVRPTATASAHLHMYMRCHQHPHHVPLVPNVCAAECC